MISSNTRATRSRYSSPANPRNSTWNGSGDASKGSGADSSRTFMQKWLEPTVQTKTSFEEDGLMRYGVVENMAPLGTFPKAKKASTNENGHPVRRIILKPSGASAQAKTETDGEMKLPAPALAAAAAAPAPAAAQATEKSEKKRLSPGSSPTAPPSRKSQRKTSLPTALQDMEDPEYDPKGDGTRRRQSGRVSLAKKAKQSASDARRPSVTHASKQAAHPSEPTTMAVTTPPIEPVDKEFVDKVVETAVDEALKHYRYPTAWALRTLYDEKCGDAEFVAMIEDVFSQSATTSALDEFSRQMEEKKREGKKDNQGCYYFVPPTTNSRFTPHKPKPAPYGKLVHADEEPRASKKVKTSHTATGGGNGGGGSGGGVGVGDTPRKSSLAGGGVKTPSRKRGRRHSASSNSSLSSAMSISSPESSTKSIASPLHQRAAAIPAVAGAAATATATATAAVVGAQTQTQNQTQPQTTRSAKSSDAPKPRPITTRGKSKQPVSNTSDSVSPTHPNHILTNNTTTATASTAISTTPASAATIKNFGTSSVPHSIRLAEAGMPGRLSSSDFIANLSAKSSKASKDVFAKASMPRDDQDDAAFWDRRRDAQKITNSYTAVESSVRGRGRGRDEEDDEDANATPARKSRRTRQSMVPSSIATRATRSASRKPAVDDGESVVSSVVESPAPIEASSTVGSRAVTPTSLRAPKKPKAGLRVKSSPVKKKGGTAAGVPRSVGEGNSAALASGASRDQATENDEYCSACGNNGDVVCCDGCPRSFHFECVDMVPSENLPDEWYCNECLFRKFPSRVPLYKGVFASALNNLEKTIPRAFSLPKKLQTRFEGVRAGADGDYEEIANSKSTKRKSGYEELPDFFKQREDGQAVLCHDCQKPATEIRAIIPCSLCPLYWHIDCLDPPLAVPPVLKTWRCPAHVDDVLIEVPSLAPAHRFRRIKGGQTITPALPRGTRNNGHIEIDWSDEPDPQDEAAGAGWPDPQSFGRTYKLPAQGIVLDFIEQQVTSLLLPFGRSWHGYYPPRVLTLSTNRLRRKGAGYGPRQDKPDAAAYSTPPLDVATTTAQPPPAQHICNDRTVDEIQASLNLIGLRQSRTDGIDQLQSALLAAADDNVLALMARASADNLAAETLTDNDKLGLRTMLAQMDAMSTRIRYLLGDDVLPSSPPDLIIQGTTPISEPPGDMDNPEKVEQLAPLTEPTPPSTFDQAEEGSMDLD